MHPKKHTQLMIFLGGTRLLPDLRKLNPERPAEHCDIFFETLGEMIEEYTASDDRKHNIAHL